MRPYLPGKPISEVRRELGLHNIVKLASNENPFGPSPKAVDAVREAAKEMHLYPDGAAYDLKAALSSHFNLPVDQITMGNGSDELIHLLGLVFLGSPDDQVIVGDPSFIRYDAAANLAPAELIKVPLDSDYRHDLSAMAKQVTDRTKLVFIANPNNPTGTIVRRSELDRFLDDLPEDTVTVLDEAYFEFAAHVPDYPNSLEYIARGRNVVGLRTFSKTYGLAGIRVGYAFSQPSVADAIERARAPFNVNSLAQVAAVAALTDSEHIERTVRNNRLGVDRLTAALTEAGAKVCESYGNFVFADLGRPSAPLVQELLQQGVIVRGGEMFGTPNCIRVSVGTESEIGTFIAAFQTVVREKAAL
jgi:histidinol-phosphate aminotransferase